jgi:Protein of unknown function (DUF1064).
MTGLRWTAEELDVKVKRGDVKIVGARLVQRGMDGDPEQKNATAANRAAKAKRVGNVPRKYGNQPTEIGAHKFASKREAKRYAVLASMQEQGEITNLRLQKRYPIVVNGKKVCVYVGDFEYQSGGMVIVEDAKGVKTSVYKLKRKLMQIVNGIEIREV